MDAIRSVRRGVLAAGSLLAAGAGLVVASAFGADLHAARARLAGQSRVVQTTRGPVEVAVSGSGPPVLLVHGTGGGFDQGLMASKSLGEGYGIGVVALDPSAPFARRFAGCCRRR